MISRSAENCFWLYRQIERVENLSRFIVVNRSFVLDVKPKLIERWYPLIIVSGEEQRYNKLVNHKENLNSKPIQHYLTWDERNPVAIYSATRQARECAHVIRSIISTDLWNAINAFWLWLASKQAQRLYDNDQYVFYEIIMQNCELIHGLYHNTMPRDEAYYFMRLGMFLERCNQLSRIMDTKYHRVSITEESGSESALETIHWTTLLDCCLASDSFMRQEQVHIKGKRVAEFLLLNDHFPRSVLYCLKQSVKSLQRLRPDENSHIGQKSYQQITALQQSLRQASIDDIFANGVHEELTRIVNSIAAICDTIQKDFFAIDCQTVRCT